MKIAPHLLISHGSEVLLNFLSSPSFQISSIASNKNPDAPEISEFFKTFNFVCQALKHLS